jgi:hypothetical protein
MLTLLLVLLVGVLAAAAGAYGGFWLVMRKARTEFWRGATIRAEEAATKATIAAVRVENLIGVEDLMERLASAEREACAAQERVREAEVMLAANFGYQPTRKD